MRMPKLGITAAALAGLLLGGWLSGAVAAQGPYSAQIQRAIASLRAGALPFTQVAFPLGTTLVEDAANILALKNLGNTQSLRVYGPLGTTYLTLSHDTFNATLYSSVGSTYLGAGGATQWFVSPTLFGAQVDNTYDLGAAGAARPRTGYFGTSVVTPTPHVTSAYQHNRNAFGTATVGPSAPAGTTSTTLVMAGLAGCFVTRTGHAAVCMSGVAADSVANDGTRVQISYGTGTAPINGAVLTGTQIGPVQQFNASSVGAATAPYGACWVVTTLTPSTTYWLDLAFSTITGGTATLTQASQVAHAPPYL